MGSPVKVEKHPLVMSSGLCQQGLLVSLYGIIRRVNLFKSAFLNPWNCIKFKPKK